MGQKIDLTDSEKSKIVKSLSEGCGTPEIAKLLGRDHRTIKRFVAKSQQGRKKRVEKKRRKLTAKDLRRIKRAATRNPLSSSAVIFQNCNLPGVSRSTRCSVLRDMAETSSEHLRGGTAGKASSSSSVMAGNWEAAGSLDQITVVRIDDTHIAGEQSHGGGKARSSVSEYYEMEYSLPAEEEAAEEEEEEGVYVIEYSNPEEEGESYQFTMSVDRSLPAKKRPAERSAEPPASRATRRKLEEARREQLVSNKSVLELGEDYSDVMNSGQKQLVCSMCPPPGKTFKRASGLAVHLKQMHHMEGKKTFFCTSCQQPVRTQVELDAHTRRHANQDAVFTCHVCPAGGPEVFSGSRWGLRKHLEKEHPGVVPRCHVCSKGFKSLASYLADQFRHVGVSPYYCAKCQIYEMTERGLSVHVKNHNKKRKREQQQDGHEPPEPPGILTAADNSATDDSDF